MRLKPGELLFGVKPEILVDCAQQLCVKDEFDVARFCEAIGAPESEARCVLNQLIGAGFVEDRPTEDDPFKHTPLFRQLALAHISEGISREFASMLLKQICNKAEAINSNPKEFPHAVECIAVFGSYLSNKLVLGDLDIGVNLSGGRKLTRAEISKDVQNMMQGRSTSEDRTLAALRLRKPKVISVHTLREVLSLDTPFRLVWGTLPT